MLMPINRDILYKDKFLAIQILSESMARDITQDEPYFVISIVSKGFNDAILAKSPHRKRVLRLQFDDRVNGKNIITDKQADQVVNFVNENLNDGIRSCIIHCTAGISRSAGVGAAISKVINGFDELFFKYYIPNSVCYNKVLEAFKK